MAEARDTSEKQLFCPICLETFESPNILPCMHTFCEKCICRHARDLKEKGAHADIITCPICRSPSSASAVDQTPDNWAKNLPSNPVVSSLLSSTQANKDNQVYCEPCVMLEKRHISVAFCVTCSEYLCHSCYISHKSFKMSRNHTITAQSVPEDHIQNLTTEVMHICQTHEEKITYFCLEHKQLCCMKCAFIDHRKCEEFLSAEDLTKAVTSKQMLENLDALNKMFVSLRDNRMTTLESIQQQKLDITKSIRDWAVIVKDMIDTLEATTMQQLEQTFKEMTIIVSDQVRDCKSAIAAIETSQRMIVQATNADDQGKIFVTLTKISQQFLKYLQKYDVTESRSNEIKIGFQRNKNLECSIQTLNSLGQVSNEASRIQSLYPDSSFEGTLMMLPRAKPDTVVTFNARIPSDNRVCSITSGVYLPNENIVLSDKGNSKLKLFDRCFHFVSDVELKPWPEYVCVVDQESVAVSVFKSVEIVSVKNNTLTRLRNISVGDCCYGIASFRKNLMVCVSGNSILTYDASYEISKRIKFFDHGVNNALCVNWDGQHIHYTVNDKIVTMDINGSKYGTFESDKLKGVEVITVDKKENIYCCGQQSNNIILTTPEGRQLCVLMSRDDGLKNPRGICLNDRNNRLLVFERESSEIKVFKLV